MIDRVVKYNVHEQTLLEKLHLIIMINGKIHVLQLFYSLDTLPFR